MSEADRARDLAMGFEAKKTGFGQAQDGWSLTLRIQDADLPPQVRDAKKGTRYMVALVELADDETAREPEVKPKSFAGQAKLLAHEKNFWVWVGASCPEDAEAALEARCGTDSCSKIIEGTDAGFLFKQLQAKYLNYKQYGV